MFQYKLKFIDFNSKIKMICLNFLFLSKNNSHSIFLIGVSRFDITNFYANQGLNNLWKISRLGWLTCNYHIDKIKSQKLFSLLLSIFCLFLNIHKYRSDPNHAENCLSLAVSFMVTMRCDRIPLNCHAYVKRLWRCD